MSMDAAVMKDLFEFLKTDLKTENFEHLTDLDFDNLIRPNDESKYVDFCLNVLKVSCFCWFAVALLPYGNL